MSSCSVASSRASAGGIESARVASAWPNLTKAGPSRTNASCRGGRVAARSRRCVFVVLRGSGGRGRFFLLTRHVSTATESQRKKERIALQRRARRSTGTSTTMRSTITPSSTAMRTSRTATRATDGRHRAAGDESDESDDDGNVGRTAAAPPRGLTVRRAAAVMWRVRSVSSTWRRRTSKREAIIRRGREQHSVRHQTCHVVLSYDIRVTNSSLSRHVRKSHPSLRS